MPTIRFFKGAAEDQQRPPVKATALNYRYRLRMAAQDIGVHEPCIYMHSDGQVCS